MAFVVPPKIHTITAGNYVPIELNLENRQTYQFLINVKLPSRTDDIQVYLLDEENYPKYVQYNNLKKAGGNFAQVQWLTYNSSKVHFSPISFHPSESGRYYLILDNTHSTFTTKTVEVNFTKYTNPTQPNSIPFINKSNQIEFPKLHEKITAVSEKLFLDKHYSQSIFEAIKVLEKEIKKKSGIKNKFGVDLVNHVFNKDNSILMIVKGKEQEQIDEREGFRFLYMGAFLGIKNPKSHSNPSLDNAMKAIEYLSFISLLLRKLDESIRTRKKTINHS